MPARNGPAKVAGVSAQPRKAPARTVARIAAAPARGVVDRRWRGSAGLAAIEVLVAMQPLGMASPQRRIQPRVADTNMLLNAAVELADCPDEIALWAALRSGGLRLLVAPTTPTEVEEHLDDRAAGQDLDAGMMRAVWRKSLAPHLRVVDPGEPDRAEIAALASEDQHDLPTAALAAILGPGSTWSDDRDLRTVSLIVMLLVGPEHVEHGLAQPSVLEIVIAIREVCALDMKSLVTAKGANMITGLGIELVRAVGKLDGRGRAVAACLALGGIAAATMFVRRNPAMRQQMIDVLRRMSAEIMRELADGHVLRDEWIRRVPAPLALDTPRLERAIARVLAAAPAPLRSDEIVQLLAGSPAAARVDVIRRELGRHPMFVPAARGLWQLGSGWESSATG